MATEYKIIKWRGGLKADLVVGNLLPREGYICTDTGEFCFCYSAGLVKWYTSKEDIQALLGNSNEAYTALLQLISDLGEETILTSLLNTQNEINTARGNHPDLGGRLDELTADIIDNYQELTSHLADYTTHKNTLATNIARINANTADTYSPNSTYSLDDYCIYENVLYKCTAAITVAEAWDASKWAAINIGDEIVDINTNTWTSLNKLNGWTGTIEVAIHSNYMLINIDATVGTGAALTNVATLPKAIKGLTVIPVLNNAIGSIAGHLYAKDTTLNIYSTAISAGVNVRGSAILLL